MRSKNQKGTAMQVSALTMSRVAGTLLILGCLAVLTGAGMYAFVKDPNGPIIFGQPPREWLRLVGEHADLWTWSTIPFMAGPIVTILGLAGLQTLLRGAGDQGYAQVGLMAFAFGAALWTVSLAARLTVDPWAAKALAATGAIPDVYTAVSAWMSVLYVIYTILTFVGLSLYGVAMLNSSLLPNWAGWVSLVYGILGLVYFAIMRDAPPFMHYLIPIMLGVLLFLA
ncbi:MAG TPA: hypothetical protein VF808_19350 [Ktedonobacterales bacterium]